MARRQKRQFVRVRVDLRVHVTLDEATREQVVPINGPVLPGRLVDLSAGGCQVVVPTYVPRGAMLSVDFPADRLPMAISIPSRVMNTRMVTREPSYALGIRFEDPEDKVFLLLEAFAADAEPADGAPNASAAPADVDEELPAWLRLLIADGAVSRDLAHRLQSEAGGDETRLAALLTERAGVAEREIVLARAEHWRLPYLDPSDYRIVASNHERIPEPLARTHEVYPLFVLDRTITLLATQPPELTLLDQIRLQTGCEIDVCITTPRDLRHLLDWGYGGFENAGRSESESDRIWSEVLADASDAPAVKLVNILLDQAAMAGASDVHIDPEQDTLRVRFRVDGVLREVPAPPKSMHSAIVSRVKILARMDIAETRKPQDGQFKFAAGGEEIDVRVSTLPTTFGEAVVLRLLRSGNRLLSLEELGMKAGCLETFDRLIHMPHGMLLVTGPTGSGKSTTLYSALTRLDRVRQSIITLEDPVEVRMPRIRQVPVNPKAGLTFAAGLRAILRQDPDVVMVGEIRDRETADIALQAALTGHLLLSTLHTNSSAAAPARLLDMGVPDFLVASALLGVLAQRLCRRLCTNCARPCDAPPEALKLLLGDDVPPGKYMKAAGCKRCGQSGYDGRVGIFELLVIDEDIRRAILDRASERRICELARRSGMRLLLEDGIDKVRRGLTTAEELMRVAGSVADQRLEPGRLIELEDDPTTPPADEAPSEDPETYERLLRQWLGHALTTTS